MIMIKIIKIIIPFYFLAIAKIRSPIFKTPANVNYLAEMLFKSFQNGLRANLTCELTNQCWIRAQFIRSLFNLIN